MSNSDNHFEKYGDSRSTMFLIWEEKLKKIKQMQKFGTTSPADTDAQIHQLKLEILEKFEENIGKEIKSGKIFWVCVAAAILVIILLGAAGSSMSTGPFAIAFWPAFLQPFMLKKDIKRIWRNSVRPSWVLTSSILMAKSCSNGKTK